MHGRQSEGHGFSHAEDGNEPEQYSRRDWLRIAGVGGAASLGVEAVHEIAERSMDVGKMADFLRGKYPKEKRNFFGQDLTYQELASRLATLSNPPLTPEQTPLLMDNFSYMLKVEDKFGRPFNTMKGLERLQIFKDAVTSRGPNFATSFGYGQINPETAMRLMLDRQEQVKKFWPQLGEHLQIYKNRRLSSLRPKETVKLLGLDGDSNIVSSFLAFQEVYNIYGRSTGGQVHGGLNFPDKRGQLHPNRRQDPRAFSLVMAGYSGTPLGPMAAKAQCYCNEFMRFQGSERADLVIDGSLGGETLKTIVYLSLRLGMAVPDDLIEKDLKASSEQEVLQRRLLALDKWMAGFHPSWKKIVETKIKSEDLEPAQIRKFVEDRYSLVTRMRKILLTNATPKQWNEISDLFDGYINTRQSGFLELISNPNAFAAVFPRRQHSEFLQELRKAVIDRVAFDELYKGVIPTAYKKGGMMGLKDDQNIPKRVTLGHELDLESPVRIPIDTKGQVLKKLPK